MVKAQSAKSVNFHVQHVRLKIFVLHAYLKIDLYLTVIVNRDTFKIPKRSVQVNKYTDIYINKIKLNNLQNVKNNVFNVKIKTNVNCAEKVIKELCSFLSVVVM